MTNWRLLESEIVSIAEAEGLTVSQDIRGGSGDKVIYANSMHEINLTRFAQALAERVVLKAEVVKVTP